MCNKEYDRVPWSFRFLRDRHHFLSASEASTGPDEWPSGPSTSPVCHGHHSWPFTPIESHPTPTQHGSTGTLWSGDIVSALCQRQAWISYCVSPAHTHAELCHWTSQNISSTVKLRILEEWQQSINPRGVLLSGSPVQRYRSYVPRNQLGFRFQWESYSDQPVSRHL